VSEFAVIEWCDWCVADSGRTHATRPCCIARRVSKMIAAARMAALSAGPAELRTAVLRSIAMRMGRMTKDARQIAYRRAMRDGWLPADLEALKVMAKEELDKGQANG
jgi:hypothetical protein